MIQEFQQDPAAKLDYAIDWSAWLAEGETIAAASWSAPLGIRVTGPTIGGGAITRVWLEASGAQERTKHRISCQITTSAGRRTKQSFLLALEAA